MTFGKGGKEEPSGNWARLKSLLVRVPRFVERLGLSADKIMSFLQNLGKSLVLLVLILLLGYLIYVVSV